MIVRIIAKRDGFRRCGIAHPAQPVEYPVERFSAWRAASGKAGSRGRLAVVTVT